MKLGNVRVTLYAQVGDADQYELGSFPVPLEVQSHGKGFFVDLDDTFTTARALIERVFGGEE